MHSTKLAPSSSKILRGQEARIKPIGSFASPRPNSAADGFDAGNARPRMALFRGATGKPVRVLQDRLISLGFLKRSDLGVGRGVFGPATQEAVKRFQQHHGLERTGSATIAMQKALQQAYQALMKR